MTRDDFDAFCATLPAATRVVQWRGSSVWKVGGKVFAMCSPVSGSAFEKIRFKCSHMSYDLLREQDGIIAAPYFARAQWVQLDRPDAMSDEDLRLYLAEAHRIITAKLTKAKRREIGL